MEDLKTILMKIYNEYSKLGTTEKNLLRRAITPEDFYEIPVFYQIYRKFPQYKNNQSFLRAVFCLGYIEHKADGFSLGKAMANDVDGKGCPVSEARIIHLTRIDQSGKAMVQLRRLLKQAGRSIGADLDAKSVAVDWSSAGKQIWYWNERSKRKLLEDYFLNQKKEQKKEI